MSYEKYKQSRNLSLEVLQEQKISQLPVKISDICKNMGIKVISYERGMHIIKRLGLESKLAADGFSGLLLGRMVIFYNNICTPQRARFTIAHELGHILLGHVMLEPHQGVFVSGPNREPAANDKPDEVQANVFASRILAPACVLWGLGVQNAGQIAKVCDISGQSAAFRMERMALLYERDKRFWAERGHGCFLQLPVERAVFAQFQPFIEANRL